MAGFSQSNRPVRIKSPLGDDCLLIRTMTGREQLGRPFQYDLVLLSEQHDLDYKAIIGQNVTIAVDKGGDEPRWFNGFISRFSQTNYERKLCEYRATMVPWLWFLTRSSDCRIFQNLTIPEILKQVFDDHGFSDYILRLHGTYKKWEYCVQYRETAFDFASRLMEQEGIYYFCKHQNGKHEVVLCDTMASHLEFKGYETLQYRPAREQAGGHEILWRWIEEHEIQPGASIVKEFDFKNPGRSAMGTASQDRGHVGSNLERFDYLGEMNQESDTERYTKLRLEEWQAEHEIYSGEGDARGICTGVRFTLKGHPRKDYAKQYLTTGTEFRIESDPFESVAEAQRNKFVYEAKLSAVPVSQEFRSPRRTPKPVVSGPQTAVVVGIKGEEIYTDKYGRVKVLFHWDRYGQADENSSCWIRVAQVWAGKKWGSIYTPRVGEEVVVEFLEGDPDRPLITGRVYNEKNLPPYDLPANKTMSTLKSNSSKGGAGFNEIRFEDKKGEEQLFMHAEKNLDLRVKNDTFETVEHDRHLIVKNDQVEQVDNDRQEKIKRDHVEEIGRDHHLIIKGKEAIKITGSHSATVEEDVIEVFKKNQSTQVTQNLYLKAQGVVIEASTGITLKVGGNAVVIDSSGVTVKGTQVVIDGALAKICSGSGSPAASGQAGSVVAPAAVIAAKAADVADPGQVAEVKAQEIKTKTGKYGSTLITPFKPQTATVAGGAAATEEAKKLSWIEIELVGEDDKPIPGEKYRVTLPDGSVDEGTLDQNGWARVEGFQQGTCKVTFPELDQEAWEFVSSVGPKGGRT